MAKGQLAGIPNWLMKRISKVESDAEYVELTTDDIELMNGTTVTSFVGYKYKNRIEFSCFLTRPEYNGAGFFTFKNVKCKGSMINVQPRAETYVALKAMVQGYPNNTLYITTAMEQIYKTALSAYVNGIVFLEE